MDGGQDRCGMRGSRATGTGLSTERDRKYPTDNHHAGYAEAKVQWQFAACGFRVDLHCRNGWSSAGRDWLTMVCRKIRSREFGTMHHRAAMQQQQSRRYGTIIQALHHGAGETSGHQTIS